MNRKPIVFVLCELSGVVRDAFINAGCHAISVDLEPSESDMGPHWQGDALDVVRMFREEDGLEPDLIIAHPPCTYLTSSGLHWNKRRPERAQLTEEALAFVQALWRLPCKRMALENPQGCINTRLPFMPRPQYIQPYQFGADASKKTGLWLRGLPPLRPTEQVPGRWVEYPPGSGRQVQRWANQTDSGQNRLGPSETRAKDRSKTYPGIADAMAK